MRSANKAATPVTTKSGGGDGHLLPLLTVADVAQVLRVSTRTVRRLIKSGALPSVTVGRSIRVRLEDLVAVTRPR
jgi:excisionase family DNA binding protein